jgi:hypothetical protein
LQGLSCGSVNKKKFPAPCIGRAGCRKKSDKKNMNDFNPFSILFECDCTKIQPRLDYNERPTEEQIKKYGKWVVIEKLLGGNIKKHYPAENTEECVKDVYKDLYAGRFCEIPKNNPQTCTQENKIIIEIKHGALNKCIRKLPFLIAYRKKKNHLYLLYRSFNRTRKGFRNPDGIGSYFKDYPIQKAIDDFPGYKSNINKIIQLTQEINQLRGCKVADGLLKDSA